MSNNKEIFETVYSVHKRIEENILTLIKNHYSEETWNSFTMERQVVEIVKFASDMDGIKSTCLDKIIKED